MKTRTKNVVCWVERGFDALDVAGFCQVLSEAGSTWNWRAYRIELASRTGGLVMSSAQYEVPTLSFDQCTAPNLVLVAGGAHVPSPTLPTDPPERWSSPDVEWVGLRGGLLPIVATGRFAGVKVAANLHLQPRLLAAEPSLRFVTDPFCSDAKLWSCATADTTPAALALVQRHVGNSARRAVETALGLAVSFPPIKVDLTPSQPAPKRGEPQSGEPDPEA